MYIILKDIIVPIDEWEELIHKAVDICPATKRGVKITI